MMSADVANASTPEVEASPFVALLRFELHQAFRRRHAVALASMVAMGFVLAFWLPMFPASVLRFFQRVFQLETWAQIVVANDLTGLFFLIYWIAVFDVLTIYVLPLEERRLDVYLSKPLSRRAYMMARLLPVLLTSMGLYAASAAVYWLTLGMARLAYPLGAFAGAAGAVLGWTLFLVAIVNLVGLWARESYTVLLVAFVTMAISILPGMFYMYRPDVFMETPKIRDVIVFPTNLIWYPDIAANWGLWLAALFLALSVVLACFSGWLIEHRDVS
jgi:hypothetical protein